MRFAVVLAIGVLAGCTFQLSGGAPDADSDAVPLGDGSLDTSPPPAWLTGFDHRKKITFTSGTTTLTDFVAAVSFGADADLAMHARDDGRDLVFTAADGLTQLDFEIEAFDGGTGALAVWVRIESFTPTTEIYLYYGGGTVDAQDLAGTWPVTRYGAVWHLTDPQAGVARDSTPNALDLTAPASSNTPAQVPDGIVGGARRYDGTDDSLQRSGGSSTPLTHGTSSYAYGAWVQVTSSQTGYDMVFYKGGASSGDPGYDLELGTGAWTSYVCDDSGNILGGVFGQEATFLGRWVHLMAVVDRATQRLRLYADGVEVAVLPIPNIGSTSSAQTVALGRQAYPLRGLIDEMRVYKTALTAEWIGAEYRNLAPSTRAAFRAIGVEETRP